MATSFRRGPTEISSQPKRAMTFGLGILWVLDGLLQLQPRMFTQSLAVNVIANALMSLPSPLYFVSLHALIRYFMPYVALWNCGISALQLALGVTLLLGSEKSKRAALVASILWGVIVWVFGEGMGSILGPTMTGGVFPGTPSIMNGFPGAALVYVVIAVFILLPDKHWELDGRFSIVRDAPVLLFAVAAALQAAPLMWTTYGQASIFAANVENLPAQLANATIVPLSTFTAAHPVLSNSIELGASVLSAFAVWGVHRRFRSYAFALAWLAFIWWFGLGLGGTLTGLGTDPNTAPAIALLMVPAIISSRQTRRKVEIKQIRIGLSKTES